MAAFDEPATKKTLVVNQMTARRHPAEIEACGRCGLSDETVIEHDKNLVQK